MHKKAFIAHIIASTLLILTSRSTHATMPSPGDLLLTLGGRDLENLDLGSLSDPFFTFSRQTRAGDYELLYQSEHVDNDLSPKWETAAIDLGEGDPGAKLRIEVC